MKKQILFSLLIFSTLVSCKKEYKCSCSSSKLEYANKDASGTPHPTVFTATMEVETKPVTKKKAKSACSEFTGSSDADLIPNCTCTTFTLGDCVIN